MDKLSAESPYWWRRDLITDITLYGPPTDGGHDDCRHRRYGLSCRMFEQLLRRSRNACEVCGRPGEHNLFGKLFIDHDHSVAPWAVRGLVCHWCNQDLWRNPDSNAVAAYFANAWHLTIVPLPCPHATPDFLAWPNLRLRDPIEYRRLVRMGLNGRDARLRYANNHGGT